MSQTVRFADLEIGDIIRLSRGCDEGYNDCTVANVEKGQVTLVRPYVHTSDFIYTGGVITYLGQEEFKVPADATAVELMARRPPEETRQKIKAIVADIKAAAERGQNWRVLELLRQL